MFLAPILFVTVSLAQLAHSIELNPSICVKTLFPGVANKRVYDILNEYLVDKFGTGNASEKDIEAQINEAIVWLEAQAAGNFCFGSFSNAAKQLQALRKLQGDNICDDQSLKVIKTNNKATRFAAYKPKCNSTRPIDLIVHHYLLQHAQDCAEIYEEKYENRSYEIGEVNYVLVIQLALGYINAKVQYLLGKLDEPKWTPTKIDFLIEDLRDLQWFNSSQLLAVTKEPIAHVWLDALKYLTREELDSIDLFKISSSTAKADRKMRGKTIQRLFKLYLLEPCKAFNNELRADILEPAIYELPMLEATDDEEAKELFLASIEYNIGIVGSKLCHQIQTLPTHHEVNIEMLFLLSNGIMES